MNPLLLNTYDNVGGAAIATYRLHRGLRSINVDSRLLVMRKEMDDSSVIGTTPQNKLKRAIRYLYARRDAQITNFFQSRGNRYFSPARCPDELASQVGEINPDLIHLFWINSGFMKIETLKKFKKPIVWTLHDMWPFTGGCHYDAECGRFKQACGNCPILNAGKEHDLSRQVWQRKRQSWDKVPVVVVATSHWLAEMARSSSLFKDQRIEVIPNGIDTDRYKPLEKQAAREAYGLPQDKHLILFSAFSATTDLRKGNQLLVPALKKIAQAGWGEKTELMIVGASEPVNPPDMGMKVHYMGHLHDEISQVLLYSAADILVAPSMQENLSNTVMESLACGTPVIAFNIGGMPDMIDHQCSGYLAEPFESDDLAAGMMWMLEDKTRRDILSRRARQTVVERYALKTVANRYMAIYRDILK
ncbi:MAG TPA: glycosyltransferase family 4 protein [Gammaproteobacteria bacterium]|nr:glycosyltransferase family 4 protein [Gammaproteobacteria bacterium]